MFNWRSSQKKPSEELYKHFKANHPEVSQNHSLAQSASTAPSQQPATTVAETLDVPASSRPADDSSHDLKDADPTPRGGNEPWSFGSSGLTPTIMDPHSSNFHLFDHLAYYPPTPGGAGSTSANPMMFHNTSNQHHGAGFGGMGISTPLSMPTSEAAINTGHPGFHGYQQQQLPTQLQQQHFANVNPFHIPHQSSFPPHHFHHHTQQQSLDFEGPGGESPIDDIGMDLGASHPSSEHSPHMLFRPQIHTNSFAPLPAYSSAEKFRFHVTLNAPTAMVAHSDEIPITYLNKGQSYTLNVIDTHAQPSTQPRRYRTFVRVSFQDEQQRQKPAQCWQLWKEGRGTNEAHQRGGRLQAVEYVENNAIGILDGPSRPRHELESSSFDGFCIKWSPPVGGLECAISVRFNFLSTDFSHSKGVKGIPVRLCAKTEVIEESQSEWPQPDAAEVSYCMVKLFRDHGAERKLSNDVAHVKKSIDKLNQQIAQIESGLRDFGGKRRRSGSVAKVNLDKGHGKAVKHRRTWSMNSVATNSGRGSAEEDLHRKLVALQDRFTSTRPASVLHLRGEEGDDPDAFPVKLSGDDFVKPSIPKQESTESGISWDQPGSEAEQGSPNLSPTPSDKSLLGMRKDSTLQQAASGYPISRSSTEEWRSRPQTAVKDILPTIPEQDLLQSPRKVQTRSPRTGTKRGSIDVSGIDPAYEPPEERPVKPVACFYVKPRVEGQIPSDTYYRAIYLNRRTIKDFNNALATKCDVEPTLVLRTVRQPMDNDLHILFDDDCVREMREGQDMTARFELIKKDDPLDTKREWHSEPADVQCDGELPSAENFSTNGYQIILRY